MLKLLLLHISIIQYTYVDICTGLDNGLALTPPMGWLSWARFSCNTNCKEDPDNCIGERLVKRITDALVSGGFRDAGYSYVCLDDCWPADQRDSGGNLVPRPDAFPNGMKALADYVHSKGMKLGLYLDVGRHTCAGKPGSQDYLKKDAETLAGWGVDMLKFDGCNTDGAHRDYGYPQMSKYLNATGRPILYYCEWLIYPWEPGHEVDFHLVAQACNMFRVYGDTYDNFHSVHSILQYYGDDRKNFSQVAGPGNWNDADMITIGNFGQSEDQSRLQMGMWAIIASPLLMSVDVATMPQYAKDLYLNPRILDISQDRLGIQGTRKMKWDEKDRLQVWTRPVHPRGSFAIAFLCYYEQGYPRLMSANLTDLGLTHKDGYSVMEVFDGTDLGTYGPNQNLTFHVNPTGIYMVRATVLNKNNLEDNDLNVKGKVVNSLEA